MLDVLVYPHAMEIGGSQLNAIELAAAVRDLDHRVAVVSEDGPLLDRVHALGLEHIAIPDLRRRPSIAVARQLRALLRVRGSTIIHGYEWPPALEAAAAVYPGRAAAVCTVMSMAIAPFLPASMPLVVGTEALRQRTAALRRGPVYLIEPPVDVTGNAPGHPTDTFRARYRLPTTDDRGRIIDIAVICRLVPELKLEGVLTAIDAVADLARERPVRLLIAGDGTARDTVHDRAERANARAGRTAVVLLGELNDPRPVYAAADIILGMGGSALRALAFGRPLVVQGERGFWTLLTPESCALFLRQGWYGVGDGTDGTARLTSILRGLLDDPGLRESLGAYGRELAVERFSLHRAARVQEAIYQSALAPRGLLRRAGGGAWDGVRSAAGLIVHKGRRRVRGGPRDDFNA